MIERKSIETREQQWREKEGEVEKERDERYRIKIMTKRH